MLHPAAAMKPPTRRLGRRRTAIVTLAAVLLAVTACAPAEEPAVPVGWQGPCPSAAASSSTPPPADRLSTTGRLLGLADTITALPADAKDAAVNSYSVARTQLWSVVDGMVTPIEITLWRDADGGGRVDERALPARPDPSRLPDTAELLRLATAPVTTTTYPGADGPRIGGAVTEPVPSDAQTLADALYAGAHLRCQPTWLLSAFVRLYRSHYLNRAARAGALRMLATIPGLAYDGIARDVIGRTGWTFVLAGYHHETILLDPDTGTLLASSVTSIDDTPQLLAYQLFLATDRTSTPGQPPGQ
jgi:hypothetical protein